MREEIVTNSSDSDKKLLKDRLIENASTRESVIAFLSLSILSFLNLIASRMFGGSDETILIPSLSMVSFLAEVSFFILIVFSLARFDIDKSRKVVKDSTFFIIVGLTALALLKLAVVAIF